jgi:hypothetical protein
VLTAPNHPPCSQLVEQVLFLFDLCSSSHKSNLNTFCLSFCVQQILKYNLISISVRSSSHSCPRCRQRSPPWLYGLVRSTTGNMCSCVARRCQVGAGYCDGTSVASPQCNSMSWKRFECRATRGLRRKRMNGPQERILKQSASVRLHPTTHHLMLSLCLPPTLSPDPSLHRPLAECGIAPAQRVPQQLRPMQPPPPPQTSPILGARDLLRAIPWPPHTKPILPAPGPGPVA